MSQEQTRELATRTGLQPRAHHDRIRRRLGDIAQRAQRLQARIVRDARTAALEVTTTFMTRAAEVPVLAADAEALVAGAYAGARARVKDTAKGALDTLEANKSTASQQLTTATGTMEEQVQRVLATSSPAVRKLHEEQMGEVDKLLDYYAKQFREQIGIRAKNIANSTARAVTTGDEPIPQGIASTRADLSFALLRDPAVVAVRRDGEIAAWPERAKQMAADVERAAGQHATEVLGQRETFSVSILQLVNPAAVQVEKVAGHDSGEVTEAGAQGTLRVATDHERAVNAINMFRDAAITQLDQGERAAVREIRAIGARLEADVTARGDNLEISILETAHGLADAYRAQMDGLNASLDMDGAPPGFLDYERVRPLLAAAEQRFEATHDRQAAELRSTVDDAVAETEDTMAAELGMARELAEGSANEAARIAAEQIGAIDGAKDGFIQAMKAPAEGVSAGESPYAATVSERLGQRPEQVRAAVKGMLTTTRTTLDKVLGDEIARYDKASQGETLAKSLSRSLIGDGLRQIGDLNKRVQKAYQAMVGTGTEENELLGALRGISANQGKAMEAIWTNRPFGGTLRGWLKDDLSGDELTAALAYLSGNVAKGARFELEASMAWYGDDEARIEEIMRDMAKGGHIDALEQTEGWKETAAALQSNLDGTDLDVTNALLAGNVHRADAYRLRDQIDAARRQGDHDRLNQILEGIPSEELPAIRREFAAIQGHEGATEDEARDAFVKFVTDPRQVPDPHGGRYGDAHGGMRTVTIQGANRDLAVALAGRSGKPDDIDSRVAIQAARMGVETQRGSANLEQLQRAFEYDQPVPTEAELQSPDPAVRKHAEQQMAQAKLVRERAMQTFARDYGGLPSDATPEQARQHAEQAVGRLFDDQVGKDFGASMVNDGRADPALAIRLATEGSGTDEELIRRTLSRMNRDEINALRATYKGKDGQTLDQALGTDNQGGFFTELSGDERLEVELLLMGQPRNDKERFEIEQKRYQQQREETGSVGQWAMSGSSDEALMEDSHARMVGMVERAGGIENAFDDNGRFIGANPTRDENGVLQPNPEEAWVFGDEMGWNQFGVDAYKAGIDRMATAVTTAITAVVVAVALIVATVATGGAALGMVIAATGGLLSMGAKAAIRGGRYGWEEAGVDLAVTAVDTAMAGLTQGMGQAMRTAGTGAKAASPLARRSAGALAGMAGRGKAGQAGAYVLSEGLENLVSAAPSALTGNLLNDRNWERGNPLVNILKGTLMETGMSMGMGMGMGAGMDVGMGAFQAVRGAMRNRALRSELTASMSPDMRATFGDVPIQEIPAKQFEQMTGSASGQAVTIFTPDGPVVMLKEGASPRVLREEGIHLAQSREDQWASRVADLSEANLARWPDMSLGEQLALYRNKLDVEIDAQKRLIDDLGDELALAGPFGRRGLRKRLAEAEASLTNLHQRVREVEGFPPERMQRIALGDEPRPQYLQEPPRLFNKKAKTKTDAEASREATGPNPMGKRVEVPAQKGDPDYSPLHARTDLEGKVVEIGPRWVEPSGREYRLVAVVDEAGKILHMRQEIRSAHADGRWVQRGKESSKQGWIAEAASQHMSASEVPRGWDQTVPMASQWNESGRGFDEVLFDFRMEGGELVARVRVVEVKSYGNRYVPLDDFTAVRPPLLDDNLGFVQNRLRNHGTAAPPEGLGLTSDQVTAALDAIELRNIDLELRLGPGTKLGARKRGQVLKALEAEWKNAGMNMTRGKARVRKISGKNMRAGARAEAARAAQAAAAAKPTGASGPASPFQRVIVEPYIGPSVDSPLHLMAQNPGALVVGAEARIRPEPAEVQRLERAGGVFVPDNMPANIPPGSVDQIVMRFPLPHDRAVSQEIPRRVAALEQQFPDMSRGELLARAVREARDAAETAVSYAPYALQRLRPGGELEVVYWEREIRDELEGLADLRYVDPDTGQGYRLALERVDVRKRGEVAPHSGFGIPRIDDDTDVFVGRLRKVPLDSRTAPDAGVITGHSSGRAYRPDQAGGPVRALDWQRLRITDRGVDAVARHIQRFDGGGELEQAMVERLRAIARGDIPATDHDLRFYAHELREMVRYRRQGWASGQPASDDAALRLWNDAHTASLEDYGMREGPGMLYHPEVEARAGRDMAADADAAAPAGAAPHADAAAPAGAAAHANAPTHTDAPVAVLDRPLPARTRRAMEAELAAAGHAPALAPAQLADLTDAQLLQLYTRTQADLLPERLRAFRDRLSEPARAEFDALLAAGHSRHDPVDAALAERLSTALDTPVRVDDTLPPGEVRVHYDIGPLGNVRGVEIRVGSRATLEDVLMHVPVLSALRRYQGVTGVLRRVIDAVQRFLRGGGRLPLGTRAHESWLEVQKLPAILRARRDRLLAGNLDIATRLRLEQEIQALEAQLAHHVDSLEEMVPGIGYIAAKGDSTLPTPEEIKKIKTDPRLGPVLEAVAAADIPDSFVRSFTKNLPKNQRKQVTNEHVAAWILQTWYGPLHARIPDLTPADFAAMVAARSGKVPIKPADLDAVVTAVNAHGAFFGRVGAGQMHIGGHALTSGALLPALATGKLSVDQLPNLERAIDEANLHLAALADLGARIHPDVAAHFVQGYRQHLDPLSVQQLLQINRELGTALRILNADPTVHFVEAGRRVDDGAGNNSENDLILRKGSQTFAVEVESIPDSQWKALTSDDPDAQRQAIADIQAKIEAKHGRFVEAQQASKVPSDWVLVLTSPRVLTPELLAALSKNKVGVRVINDALPFEPVDLDAVARAHAPFFDQVHAGEIAIDGHALSPGALMPALTSGALGVDQVPDLMRAIGEANVHLAALADLGARIHPDVAARFAEAYRQHLEPLSLHQLLQINRELDAALHILSADPTVHLVTAGSQTHALAEASISDSQWKALGAGDPEVRLRAIAEIQAEIQARHAHFVEARQTGKLPAGWVLVLSCRRALTPELQAALSNSQAGIRVIGDALP